MSTPILATKLFVPPPRPKLVSRPRLIERLNEGLHRKLTLISAPAGFGKTTLASEWVYQKDEASRMKDEKNIHTSSFIPHPSRVAWLSLDEGDSDPRRFLTYLIAALQTVAVRQPATGNIGEELLAVLQSRQPPPAESVLTVLLNEITAIMDNLVLLLDDYHVIDAKPVDHALTFLLDHLPPQMHVVIATREDPQLPLARLRARGQMTEVRAKDLRFTPAEAAGFLNQVMGLDLSSHELAALDTRTEGWIAGLQLAALSMQGREDVHEFVRTFAGNNRYIVDYLVAEVLQRQPERVRSFLLQTSILARLNGPLCDAVTDQGQGRVRLEVLERDNLFVVPLDDKREWFRYHHLFADVLHAHLLEEQPDRVPALHRQASEWFEQNGLRADAVRHALAAKDFERAACLVELAWPEMDATFRSATWLGWVKALPDELVRTRPVLSVGYAWALLNGGELEAGEVRLRDAERGLDSTAEMNDRLQAQSDQFNSDFSPSIAKMDARQNASTLVFADEEQFRSLPASIAAARAYLAQARGDVPAAVTYGRRALDLTPEEDHLRRGIAAALLGIAYWASGELAAAESTLADGMESMRIAGNTLFAIRGTYALADIRLAQGRLRQAIRTYENSLQLAAEHGKSALRAAADLNLRLSELHFEQDNLRAATQHLLQGEDLGQHAASPHWQYRLCLAQARIAQAQGDLDGALDLLDEAERHYVRTPIPDFCPVAALKTRMWVALGRLTEAQAWVREQGLSIDDELSYLREFEHVTLARVLIAEYRSDHADRSIHEARELLDRLMNAAEEGRRMGTVIELLVLQALAHEAQGNISPALISLERALMLAEPEGYVRIFVVEGPPMAKLLTRMMDEGGRMLEYIRKLLAAFTRQTDVHPSSLSPQPLVEPLSQRELEVLQLVAQGLSNREIGERLFVALDTVKGHNRRIYGKLQVQRRTEAVARARELGLL